MKSVLLTAALTAAAALAAPALANGPYVGGEIGYVIAPRIDYRVEGDTIARAGKQDGFAIGTRLGYDLGLLSIEAEVSYRRVSIDKFRTFVSAPGLPAGTYDGRGRTTAASAMLNALVNVVNTDKVKLYAGGGAGIARVRARNYGIDGGPTLLSDTDRAFAWQAIAGADYKLTPNVAVGARYAYFDANKIRFDDLKSKFRAHTLSATVTYAFGHGEPEPAPPPPPPPPPPAPPPPPPPPPEAPSAFIVFFDWNKSSLTDEARSILDNVATTYQTTGRASVTLAGHADTSGPAPYNQRLSQRRADAVKTYLAGKGVPGDAMTTEAFGETKPLVETADGVREPQNRRVEITMGPGSGQ